MPGRAASAQPAPRLGSPAASLRRPPQGHGCQANAALESLSKCLGQHVRSVAYKRRRAEHCAHGDVHLLLAILLFLYVTLSQDRHRALLSFLSSSRAVCYSCFGLGRFLCCACMLLDFARRRRVVWRWRFGCDVRQLESWKP